MERTARKRITKTEHRIMQLEAAIISEKRIRAIETAIDCLSKNMSDLMSAGLDKDEWYNEKIVKSIKAIKARLGYLEANRFESEKIQKESRMLEEIFSEAVRRGIAHATVNVYKEMDDEN
jgi:hypothetical protein